MVIRPLSSGSRSASRAARGNSGSSSRKSTPPWASEISPGRGGEPPPTSATALAEWCGARKGRWPKRPASKPWLARPCSAALASASSSSIGGRMPPRRSASIDLPVPGGPMNSRLCAPAAAISSARLAPAWPLTSRRSGPAAAAARGSGCARGSSTASSPGCSDCTTCSRLSAARMSSPATCAAASALGVGSTRQRVVWAPRTARASASAPRTGRSSPASDSSPANSKPSSRAASMWPAAARMPSAIGRSKRPDSLGRSAGARLTVMRLLCGKGKPLCGSAARTRSRDSLTSVSASPTSVKLGRPLARCTSTVTAWACSASSARLWTTAKDMDVHHASAARPGSNRPAHQIGSRVGALRPIVGRVARGDVEAGADSPNWRSGTLSAYRWRTVIFLAPSNHQSRSLHDETVPVHARRPARRQRPAQPGADHRRRGARTRLHHHRQRRHLLRLPLPRHLADQQEAGHPGRRRLRAQERHLPRQLELQRRQRHVQRRQHRDGLLRRLEDHLRGLRPRPRRDLLLLPGFGRQPQHRSRSTTPSCTSAAAGARSR